MRTDDEVFFNPWAIVALKASAVCSRGKVLLVSLDVVLILILLFSEIIYVVGMLPQKIFFLVNCGCCLYSYWKVRPFEFIKTSRSCRELSNVNSGAIALRALIILVRYTLDLPMLFVPRVNETVINFNFPLWPDAKTPSLLREASNRTRPSLIDLQSWCEIFIFTAVNNAPLSSSLSPPGAFRPRHLSHFLTSWQLRRIGTSPSLGRCDAR